MRPFLDALREIGRMRRLRLLAIAFLVGGLACVASAPAFANILIQIDKPSQTMTVSVDGQLLYRWPVSTGATGFSTPDGSYTPFRIEVMPRRNGTMPACRMRSSSPRGATASMAQTIQASARPSPTAASASR
jgi:hypothetical protein